MSGTRAIVLRSSAAVALALVLVLVLAPAIAAADPGAQDRVLANALFDEARSLMREGRYAEACPKFAESLRLQPGGGTLLNLGVCHENEGKTATAWGELKAALALARRDGRADREQLALERLAVIEPRLSYVTIRVPAEARVAGLEVRLDGTLFGEASWGAPRPIDPGPHQLRVLAPGHERFEKTFRIEDDARQAFVYVPVLAISSPPAPPPPILRSQHIGGLVAGSIGVVGVALGAAFGATAQGAWSDAEEGCPRPDRCTHDAAAAASDAARFADLSTLAFVVGGVGLGLGAILFATGPSLVIQAKPGAAAAAMSFRW